MSHINMYDGPFAGFADKQMRLWFPNPHELRRAETALAHDGVMSEIYPRCVRESDMALILSTPHRAFTRVKQVLESYRIPFTPLPDSVPGV